MPPRKLPDLGAKHPVSPDSNGWTPAANGTLYNGASVTNGTPVYLVFPVSGAARTKVRLKTSGNGALDLDFGFIDGRTGVYTAYTTGNEAANALPTQVAVTGGTETAIQSDLYGEAWARAKFTPSADGTITHVFAGQV